MRSANCLERNPQVPKRVGARKATAVATAMNRPLYVGFYGPWDESSTASLQRHIGDLDWLAPVWVTVTGPNHQFNILPDPNGRAIIDSAAHRPLILPVVQNFANGQVDPGRHSGYACRSQSSRASSWTSSKPFSP